MWHSSFFWKFCDARVRKIWYLSWCLDLTDISARKPAEDSREGQWRSAKAASGLVLRQFFIVLWYNKQWVCSSLLKFCLNDLFEGIEIKSVLLMLKLKPMGFHNLCMFLILLPLPHSRCICEEVKMLVSILSSKLCFVY